MNLVAERIVDMANLLAGNDPAKLSLMREAFHEGFIEANSEFKAVTCMELPQITIDTYNEVMHRLGNA